MEDCFSDKGAVISNVLQASVLVPVLFIIQLNALDKNVLGMVSNFADDCKIGGSGQ